MRINIWIILLHEFNHNRFDSYNEVDKTVLVYLLKEIAGRLTDREAAKEQARLEREEKSV